MQNEWWTYLADGMQINADCVDYGSFYQVPKAVYGSSHQIHYPLRSADVTKLLTDKDSILNR